MGKATRWLKGLLGKKKEKDSFGYSGSCDLDKRENKRLETDDVSYITPTGVTTFDRTRFRSYVAQKENVKNKHSIVVRSKSYDRGTLLLASREGWASVLIQSFFRGYLARKALRALKALVKIQALVRGHLVRKRVAATLHSVQAMIRAQAVARSMRAHRSRDKENRIHPQTPSRKYVEQFDEARNYQLHNRRVPILCKTPLSGFDENSKIVEVDTHLGHSRCRRINTARSECGEEVQYHGCPHLQEFEWYLNVDEGNNKFSTAHNTPRLPNTPVKSVCGETLFRPCSNFPNYMANTHSSKAKLRSHSAPKQRPELRKRLSINEMMAARNSVSGVGFQWSSSNPRTQDYCLF